MRVGVLVLDTFDFSIAQLTRYLYERGYSVTIVTIVGADEDFLPGEKHLAQQCNAVLVCGNIRRFISAVKSAYAIDDSIRVFNIGDVSYVLCEQCTRAYVEETVIPVLNAKCKTFYTTVRFKTFGHTADTLRKVLADAMKKYKRMVFDFRETADECEVTARYSSKTPKESVEDMIAVFSERLQDCLYTYEEKSLAEVVSELIRSRGKKLCIAESFTGGGIAAALTAIPGASEFLYEDMVCYAPAAKTARLGVDAHIIERHGAVSVETAYEMAAGLLMQGNCDIAIATTGNAGPTAEKDGDVGHCFIAIGDSNGIHIFEHVFNGTRVEVIAHGVTHALFNLYKLLRKSEFTTLLKQQTTITENTEKIKNF